MKVNQLRAGVIMTYVNIGLGSLIPFVYTPIMLRLLGQSEYGLYSLANSVVGYLSLLSFGLGSTIVRYVAKYRAEGNKEQDAYLPSVCGCGGDAPAVSAKPAATAA